LLDDTDMSSNSNTNTQASNHILNPFIEGITQVQSIAISLIDAYSEFVRRTPEMIEQWYNIFCNQQNNTTEKQVKERVKVE
jgi:polyhydroxyalkanoate synthesis regulator protein